MHQLKTLQFIAPPHPSLPLLNPPHPPPRPSSPPHLSASTELGNHTPHQLAVKSYRVVVDANWVQIYTGPGAENEKLGRLYHARK